MTHKELMAVIIVSTGISLAGTGAATAGPGETIKYELGDIDRMSELIGPGNAAVAGAGRSFNIY